MKHQFTGQEKDDSTGLHYYGARYYDSQLGRFITADPTVQNPEDAQDLNRYAYARNNPINFTDPTGFGFWKKLFKIALIAIAVVAAVVVVAAAVSTLLAGLSNLLASGSLVYTPSISVAAGVGTEAGAVGGGFAGLSSGAISGISAASGLAAGTATGIALNQATKTLNPNSQTAQIHFDENADWLNRLKDATAGGPGPNLLPQTSLPSGGPPTPGGGAQVAVAGASTLLVNQGIAIAPPEVYTASKPRSNPGPKKGSKGGKGAGKGFSSKVKDFVRNIFNNKCAFCGKDTIRSQGPDPDRSNIDHAIPRSRGGNNSVDNAQNTCQSCNLSKGDMTTVEFLSR